MARAALRVMVLQRFMISSVLGLGGTLGGLEDFSLSLDTRDPALSESMLDWRSERLISGLLLPLWRSSLELEENSLLEENWDTREMLRSLVSTEVSRSRWAEDQGSERMSRDRALTRRPGIMLDCSPETS